ncbi:T9SS type A sorting domain-containing protein [Viscerimonas tarda]
MKKKNLLLASIMMLFSFSLFAQTYDLRQMTPATFQAGGGPEWSFERYTYASGDYKALTLYTDSSVVNWYDIYVPEWINGVKLGEAENLAIGGDNIWQANKRFAWADSIRPAGRPALTYWPYVSEDFEVYPTKEATSIISFKAPANGYYKVNYTLQRQDGGVGIPLKALTRFRYKGETKVNALSTMSNEVSFGDNSTQIDYGDAVWADIRETLPRFTPNTPESFVFAFKAEANDIVSFEIDCRQIPIVQTSSWARDAWGRTNWKELKIEKVSESEAKGVTSYCDPYDDSALDPMWEAYDELEAYVNNANIGYEYGQYPPTAVAIVQALLAEINTMYDNNAITGMNAVVYLAKLEEAKIVFDASKITIDYTAQGNYRLFPYTEEQAAEHAAIFSKDVASVWDFGTYVPTNGVYKVFGIEGGTYNASGQWKNANAWYDGAGEWMFVASDGNIHPTTTKSPVIYFTAPVDGVYRVGATIRRLTINPNLQNPFWARFRFLPEGASTIAKEVTMGFDVEYGNRNAGDGLVPKSSDFYVNMKAGDRITFEEDAYTSNSNGNGGSIWDRLYVLSTEDGDHYYSTADAEASGAYYNPYGAAGDFTELSALIGEANAFIATVTIGDEAGSYPEAAKEALETAIAKSQALVSAATAAQPFIEIEITSLKAALATFKGSKIFLLMSEAADAQNVFESGLYYLRVKGTNYYLTSPTVYDLNSNTRGALTLQVLHTESLTEQTGQVWNIQYNVNANSLNPARYTIVSELDGDTWTYETDLAGHVMENGQFGVGGTVTAQSATGDNYTWRNHSIYYDGAAYCLYNVRNNWSLMFAVNEETGATVFSTSPAKEAIWDIVKFGNLSGINEVSSASVGVISTAGGIKVTGISTATVNVYNLLGTLVSKNTAISDGSFIPLSQGFYIVNVINEGKSITTKVIVK